MTAFLQPGLNQLAIAAVNGGSEPNPAGVIGCLKVQLESGAAVTERVSKAWKASNQKADHWTEAGFDDSAWTAAREVAPFGRGPWGKLAGNVTVGPVQADPFLGHCDLASADLKQSLVYLELGALNPEIAARVTVNGVSAGGLIGKPARLEISRHLKPGANTLRLEPFAPESVRLVVYSKFSD